MKLIRIEHPKTGCGIYYSRSQRSQKLNNFLCDFSAGEKHPEPRDDSKLYITLKEKYRTVRLEDGVAGAGFLLYGFSSINQLRAWFYSDDILQEMHNSGFVIVEIEGDITEGNCQATVDKTTITSKVQFNLEKYLNL